ncbi:hypothetical protein K1719_044317 [Acacia pycnantha]|nr:hypothetical protein K1719_044317 [Acacia pycnantha]
MDGKKKVGEDGAGAPIPIKGVEHPAVMPDKLLSQGYRDGVQILTPKADLQSCVPFEFYNVESLRRIGNMIGKMIKVDRTTSIYDKGGFARICVEIDLQQLLLPSYTVFGEERPIIYEGLHQETNGKEAVGGATIVTGDGNADEYPFGKIKILRREFRGASSSAGLKWDDNESLKLIDSKRKNRISRSQRCRL